MAEPLLVHGTCISIEGTGILIRGASGTGKTQTALCLFRRLKPHIQNCFFVTDDQTLLTEDVALQALVASCPEPICGKIEVFGFGIIEDHSMFCQSATIGLLVDLVDDRQVARMAPETEVDLLGFRLPRLLLPMRKPDLCVNAIVAAIYGHARF
ncbi:MAG: aldolase [Pseudomonadota bacterium]